MKPLRVYVDTSVFGGCFDAQFAEESTRFFDLVRAGRIVVLVSQVVVDELSEAPPRLSRRNRPDRQRSACRFHRMMRRRSVVLSGVPYGCRFGEQRYGSGLCFLRARRTIGLRGIPDRWKWSFVYAMKT